jgi:hypothetical protein
LGSHTASTWIVAIACSVGATACKSADTMLVIVPLEPPPVMVIADRIEFTIVKDGASPLVRTHPHGFEAAAAKYGLEDIAGSYAGTVTIRAEAWKDTCKVAIAEGVTATLIAGKSNDVPTLHARNRSCDNGPTDAGADQPDAGPDGAPPPSSDAGVDAAAEDTAVAPDAALKPDAPAWNLFAPQFMQGDQPTSPRLAAISGDRTLLAWRKSGNPVGISVGDLQLPDRTALSNPKTDNANPPAGLALIHDGMLPNPHSYIAWAENSKVFVKRYDGSAPWVQLGDSFGAPGATTAAECPALLFDSSGQLVVAWSQGSPVASVYLRTWNDPSWSASYSGPLRGGVGDSSPACPLLARGGPTTLAAAWVEGPAQGKLIYVQRYVVGNGWQPWGAPLPANPMATTVRLGGLVLDADGLPTVAWQEATPGKSAIFVKRWDKAGMWVQAGNAIPEITVTGADGAPALAIDDKNNAATPLLAWYEYANTKVSVRVWQLSGDTWKALGNPLRGASGDPAELSLSYGGGVPWVVFTDVSTVSRGLYPWAFR